MRNAIWGALAGVLLVAAGFGGYALAPASAHALPHEHDPNYVPVLVWEDDANPPYVQGTNLEYKPADGYWTCVANMEANPDMEGPCPTPQGQAG